MLFRKKSNTMLLFKIFTTGLSRRHKTGTGIFHHVAKQTVPERKKSTADGISFSAAVVPSNISTPMNKNREPSTPSDDFLNINTTSIKN